MYVHQYIDCLRYWAVEQTLGPEEWRWSYSTQVCLHHVPHMIIYANCTCANEHVHVRLRHWSCFFLIFLSHWGWETIFLSWWSCCLCVQYVSCACDMFVCSFLSSFFPFIVLHYKWFFMCATHFAMYMKVQCHIVPCSITSACMYGERRLCGPAVAHHCVHVWGTFWSTSALRYSECNNKAHTGACGWFPPSMLCVAASAGNTVQCTHVYVHVPMCTCSSQ